MVILEAIMEAEASTLGTIPIVSAFELVRPLIVWLVYSIEYMNRNGDPASEK